MAAPARTWFAWCSQRRVRQWFAGFLLFSVLASVLPLVWQGTFTLLASWQVFAFGVIGLVVLLIAFRKVWFGFFSPVVRFDLVRSSRRNRFLVLRCAYAVALLGLLFWFHWQWFKNWGDFESLFSQQNIAVAEMPRFAASFFAMFLTLQYLVVLLLTPVYLGGAIAEEKEQRTLEYLLATDLNDREIVFSKLAARLAGVGLLLLTGLPVLALTQLWGGVDPALLLAGFAITGATVVSLGSLALLNSVFARRPLDAVVRTYVYLALFLVFGGCIPGLNFGHPVTAYWVVAEGFAANNGDAGFLLRMATIFTLIHLLGAIVFLYLAVRNLRPAALRTADPNLPSPVARSLPARHAADRMAARPRERRQLRADALLWKEMYVEQEFRWDRLNPLVALGLLFFAVIAVSVGITILLVGLSTGSGVAEPMNTWLRSVGTPIACIMFVVMALYAASTVSRERERQTLDSLLLVPEDWRRVLRSKWLGSFLSVRQTWWCLAAIWGWGVLTGGLHPLALPLVLVAWGVYAGLFTSVGLYFSTSCRTTLRATLCTFVACLFLFGWGWLLPDWRDPPLVYWLPEGWGEALTQLEENGLRLPMPLVVLAFRWGWSFHWPELESPGNIAAALAGLGCYALLGLGLWRLALRRFRP
jgi:ABC-type transport system involved in multi-copper enzyme maturation permease subunit